MHQNLRTKSMLPQTNFIRTLKLNNISHLSQCFLPKLINQISVFPKLLRDGYKGVLFSKNLLYS